MVYNIAGIADRRWIGMCCDTCRKKLKLEQYDYSCGGCDHIEMPGYICLAFKSDGVAVWMHGVDPKKAKCEECEERK